MRTIHRVILDDISDKDFELASDIISKALSNDFGRLCAVFRDGHVSDAAIAEIPKIVSVFVISNGENKIRSIDKINPPPSTLAERE